ncbi:ribonuclease H-like domain-containing protein [Aspergillus germanicus]
MLQADALPIGALGPMTIPRPNGPVPVKSIIKGKLPPASDPEPRHDHKLEKRSSGEKTTIRDTDRDVPAWQWVSTTEQVAGLVRSLEGLPNDPPSLYIDLEGVNLGRHGTVSILQMYVLPHDRTYLIDIHTLGERAFSSEVTEGGRQSDTDTKKRTTTLKSIFESSTIKKVIFDVRHDSDALHAHFGIRLAGIEDLQLMELGTRGGERTHVKGLSHCIRLNIPFAEWKDGQESIDRWLETKEKGRKLFAPEHGGSFEVFNQRPLSEDVLRYCIEDVRLLPILWKVYNGLLTRFWRKMVDEEVENRIRSSQSAKFKGSGWHMTLAPAGWDDVGSEEEEEYLDDTEPGLVADGWDGVHEVPHNFWDNWNYRSPEGHHQMDDAADTQNYWSDKMYATYSDPSDLHQYSLPDGYQHIDNSSDTQNYWPGGGYVVYKDPSGLHIYMLFDAYQSGISKPSISGNYSSGDGSAGYDDPWKDYDFKKYEG